jgi:hypothetical protein
MSLKDVPFDFATADAMYPVERMTQYLRFLEVTSGGGTRPRVRITGLTGGWDITLSPGRAVRLPAGERGFVIQNASGVPMAGLLAAGGPGWDIEDSSVAGTVNVVDGGKAKTLAGQVAIVSILVGAAGAGIINAAGLWNPAGSGKNLICKRLHFSSPTAQALSLTPITAALAGAPIAPASFLVGAPYAGAVQGTWANAAVGAFGVALGRLGVYDIAAGVGVQLAVEEPMVIPPGNGVVAVTGTANTGLTVNVAFAEEDTV